MTWLLKMRGKLDKIALRLLLISMLVGLSGCGTVKGWLEEESYELPPTELVEFTAEFTPVKLWSTDTGGGSDSDYSDIAVWLQNEMAVVVDYEGDVSAYNAATGGRLWQVSLDVPVITGAGGGEGLILIGTQEGEVLALDETNGDLLWKQQLTSEVLAPPKAANGVVVARTADGRMRGFSATDGTVLWNYQRKVPLLSLRGASAAMIAGDKVIAGYASGKLVALSIKDGQVVWEKSVAVSRGRSELERLVDIDADPVIKNGVVYAVAYNGQVAAFDLETGQKLWSRDMSSRSGLDVASSNNVYISDDMDYVWALQGRDALWRQTRLLRRKLTAPVVVGNHVLVGDFEGYVHWISRDDGRFVARTQISKSAIRSKPAVKNDIVYILANDGELTAFRIQ
ncbi:MAG: outer membrane protein assembly factor BamB [Methylophaga sp.]|nr:MAG: outer membrane protein assembly factor BamB [Methylophaga sp.]